MDIQEIKDRYSEYNFHFHKDHYEKEAPLIHAINILLVEIDNLTTERNNLQSRSMNAESKTMEIEYNIGYLIDKYKKIQQQDKPFKAFRNTPERIIVDVIKDLNELLRSAAELNQAADAISELMAENAELREEITKSNNIILDIAEQFSYECTPQSGRAAITSGGLSALESAFSYLKWEDPHYTPERECDFNGCHKHICCGTPTENGYRHFCHEHGEKYFK